MWALHACCSYVALNVVIGVYKYLKGYLLKKKNRKSEEKKIQICLKDRNIAVWNEAHH